MSLSNASKKLCLVFATVYSDNMGVNALTYSAIYILEKVSLQLGVKFEYILIGTGCGNAKIASVLIDGKNIDYKFIPLFHISIPYNIKWLGQGISSTILDSDLIIDLSEGDSFSDIYGIGRLRKNIYPKIISLLFKKKYVLFPQTIGPFSNIVVRKISNMVMRKIDHIYPRDRLSHKYLLDNIPNKIFTECIDMAFALPFEPSIFCDNKVHLGLNVSALLWNGGYTQSNMFNLLVDYQSLIGKILEEFIDDQNIVVHLISHVFSDNFVIEDDFRVAKEIHKFYPDTVLAPKFNTPIEAKNYISGMHYFIGSRMHACIAAMSAGVPVLPIAYSRKFNGLFLHSLGYNHIADPTADNEENIVKLVKKGYCERLQIAKELKEMKSTIQGKLDVFVKSIAKIIDNI